MKRILLCFMALMFTLSLFTACSDTNDEPLVSEDINEPAQTPVVSVDEVNEEAPAVSQETRIWYEFKGKVTNEREIDGVIMYTINDEICDFPYHFIAPDAESTLIEDFSVGDYVRLFVFDEPGLYEVDEENIQTVYPDMILTYEKPTTVFYAEVMSIDNGTVIVDGLEINNINFRDEFSLSIDESTEIMWRGTYLNLDSIQVGDTIAVYFGGEVIESSPARIPIVKKIEKLND